MKISELIEHLNDATSENGDMEVYAIVDGVHGCDIDVNVTEGSDGPVFWIEAISDECARRMGI